jgi:hypothetical protein
MLVVWQRFSISLIDTQLDYAALSAAVFQNS